MNRKGHFKKAFDDELFKDNPFNHAVKERAISKINNLENQRTFNKRFKLIYSWILTVGVCAVVLTITINMINNNNVIDNSKEANHVANEEEKKTALTATEKELLTSIKAIEEYKELPDNIRSIFNENLLRHYNEDPDFREKVGIALTMTKYLSVYKLEAMADKVPDPNFNWGFSITNGKVYIIGEEWKTIESVFSNLTNNSKDLIIESLSLIAKEYVVNTGELDFPEGTEMFKPQLTLNDLDSTTQNTINNDVNNKIVGLNKISGSMVERDNLIHSKISDFLKSYQEIQGIDNQQDLDAYFQLSRDLYIFAFIILKPVEVEVLKEPRYISNEEQVIDIIENYPR